nr:hypothetical protein [Tanacetum cinerariifolium]
MDVQIPTLVAPLPMYAPTLTPSTIATITTTQQAPLPPATAPSTLLQDLPNFGSLFGFDNRLKTLEANFSEFMQTNQFAGAVSSIPGIVHRYMDQRMNESIKVAIQLQSDRLREEAQKENYEFLKTIDENMQKIIKEQVKEQVKALVEVYESDKIILDTYGDTVTLKRRHDDDADKDKEPFAGSDRGSKRYREGKEPESASVPKEKATRSLHVIPFDHFINNDLEYLRGGASSRKYTTSVTKTKAADYGHIKWIEDLVLRTMWNQEPIGYDKHALWGISHWGRKREITIKELRKKLEIVQKEKDGIQLNVDKFEHAPKSLNKLIECHIVDNCKKSLGYENYNAVSPPYTGNFMPPTPDLSFTSLDKFVNEPLVENCKVMSSEEEPKVVRKYDDAARIKEWVSDGEEDDVSQPKIEKKTVRPSIVKIEFVKSKQQEKTARKTVKQVEQHRQNTHSPRGNQRN